MDIGVGDVEGRTVVAITGAGTTEMRLIAWFRSVLSSVERDTLLVEYTHSEKRLKTTTIGILIAAALVFMSAILSGLASLTT